MPLAVQTLGDLNGASLADAIGMIERAGFAYRGHTAGGYAEYRHADGCELWIRPSGEVIRLGPKRTGPGGKKYRIRYDRHGMVTSEHSTGERIRVGR